MRTLSFIKGEDDEKYSCLYTGITVSPRGFTDGETRVIGNVLDKLEEIGTPVRGDDDSATFALSKDGAVLLEEAEYSLMVDAFRKVAWRARGSRIAAKTRDWLLGVKEQKAVSATA